MPSSLLFEPLVEFFLRATRGIHNVTVGDDAEAGVTRGDTLMDGEDAQRTSHGKVKLGRAKVRYSDAHNLVLSMAEGS